jgi:hypothetical protein
MQAAARTLGLQLHVLHASTDPDLDAVFATMAQLGVGALLIWHEPEVPESTADSGYRGSDGGERCGNAGTRIRQARLREASASEPSMKCRKRLGEFGFVEGRNLSPKCCPAGTATASPTDGELSEAHDFTAEISGAPTWVSGHLGRTRNS